jgi:hypothetical protein
MRISLIAGRVAVAALVVWTGWIHYHLWSGGYRHIHLIGPLFIANAVGALALAVGLLVAPRRLLPLAAAGAVLFAGSTLVGLAVSVNAGLFGFHESMNAPFARESVFVEGAVLLAGAALAVSSGLLLRRSATGTRFGPGRAAPSAG